MARPIQIPATGSYARNNGLLINCQTLLPKSHTSLLAVHILRVDMCSSLRGLHFRLEVEVNLRPTVSRSVCLGVRRPSGTWDQFFFLLEISFRQYNHKL
jgi:hypothetical protein